MRAVRKPDGSDKDCKIYKLPALGDYWADLHYYILDYLNTDDCLDVLLRFKLGGQYAIVQFDRQHGYGQDLKVSARPLHKLQEFLSRMVFWCTTEELTELHNLIYPTQVKFRELGLPDYKLSNSLITSKITKLSNVVSGVILYLLVEQNVNFPEYVFHLFQKLNVCDAFNGVPYSDYSTKNPNVVLKLTTRFKKFLEHRCYFLDDGKREPFLDGLLEMGFDHTLYQNFLPGGEMVQFYHDKVNIIFEYIYDHVVVLPLVSIVLKYLFPVTDNVTPIMFSKFMKKCL
jgi:hypothetical protein